MKKETNTTTKGLKYSDFGKKVNAEGYQITYKGKNIGGAGILGKYKGRGKNRIAQINDYSQTAEREIQYLISGSGESRYYKVIDEINAALTTTKGELLTYKVSNNFDNDFYTDDEQEAKNMFQTYIADYGDGIRLYEAIKDDNDTEEIEWELIDSYDEDDYEDAEPTVKGELLQDEWFAVHNGKTKTFDIYTANKVAGIASVYCSPIYLNSNEDKEAANNATLICQAVNERQKLLDSHAELLDLLRRIYISGINTKNLNPTTLSRIEPAINNAKNIQP